MSCDEIRTGVKSFPETRQALQQTKVCVQDIDTRIDVLEDVPPPTIAGASVVSRRITLLSDRHRGRRCGVTPVKTAATAAFVGQLVRCDPTGGVFTITLPGVGPDNAGDEIVVKHVSGSANDITVAPTGSDDIDGSSSATVSARGSLVVVSDGESSWMAV